MSKLQTMKILDVQWGTPKMPDDVKEFFFNHWDDVGNDVWVNYTVGESSECNDDKDELSILDKWLISECDLELNEKLLMKYWW